MRRLLCIPALYLSTVLVACGGSPKAEDASDVPKEPPAETAGESKAEPAAKEDPKAEETKAEKKTAEKGSAKDDKAEEETGPTPQPRQLTESLTLSNVAYMVNYNQSAPKEAAEKACPKAEKDPKKHAACMDKARDKFVADVLRFHKDDAETTLTIYRRKTNKMVELSKAVVVFSKEEPKGVTVQIKSEKGKRPLFTGQKEFALSAPSDATLELDDPKLGKLVYEARIGLIDK